MFPSQTNLLSETQKITATFSPFRKEKRMIAKKYWSICLVIAVTIVVVCIVCFFHQFVATVQNWWRLDFRGTCDRIASNRYIHSWFRFIGMRVEKLSVPIFAINLPRSKERRRHIRRQADVHDLNLFLFTAVDGKHVQRPDRGTAVVSDWNGGWTVIARDATGEAGSEFDRRSNAEIACTLSHCLALLNVAESSLADNVVVMVIEDDASFDLRPAWNHSIANLVDRLPSDWDFLSLYRSCQFSSKASKDEGVFDEYAKSSCSGNVAYLLPARAARAFARKWTRVDNAEKSVTISLQVAVADEFVQEFALPKAFVVDESLVVPNNDTAGLDSTIHPTHTLGHVSRAEEASRKRYEQAVAERIRSKNGAVPAAAAATGTPQLPKVLHLIWIGPKPLPQAVYSWTVDFAESPHGRDWTVKLWRDDDLRIFGLTNFAAFDAMPELAGKTDVARYEIMYRHGGVYIDADTVWLGTPFTPTVHYPGLCNFVRESPSLVANGYIACVRNHPFLAEVISAIASIPKDILLRSPAWKVVGPLLVTEMLKKLRPLKDDVAILPLASILCIGTESGSWVGNSRKTISDALKRCMQNPGLALAFHWGLSSNGVDNVAL